MTTDETTASRRRGGRAVTAARGLATRASAARTAAAAAAARRSTSAPSPAVVARPPAARERVVHVMETPGAQVQERVPMGLRTAAAWSWRLLIVGVMIYVLARGFTIFQVIIVPLLISLLIVALVRPIHQSLTTVMGRRPHNGLAALLTILVTLGIVSALIGLISQQVATGFPSLRRSAEDGIVELQTWLADGPLNLSGNQINEWIDQARETISGNSDGLVSGALQVTSTAGHVLTGLFLVLFASFFFLSGGREIWTWMVGLFPGDVRERVDGAGARAWATLTAFVRATLIVALVDGIGVGVAAAVLGVPLAIPLGVLVFIGAFVPIVGALVTGFVAVMVALVAQGPTVALFMLLAVIAVQQIEAHVLQPFLLGRAVQVHPLAVIVAIAAGVLLAGIVGALFAVPFIAVINSVAGYLSGREERHDAGGDAAALDEQSKAGPLADDERGETTDLPTEPATGGPEQDRDADPADTETAREDAAAPS